MARLLLPLLAIGSALLSALYAVDLWVTTSRHASGCQMTYSWPVYTAQTSLHDKYQLYSVHMKQRRAHLTGVPVLFLPGHLGSYEQSRSIARHLWDIDADMYDVFAADFKGEPTGLHGKYVTDQAQFVNDAVRFILKQYKKQNSIKRKFRVPESVIIVAHSMGGIVARTAETLANYKRNSILHVVSLGTPYAKPPFPMDVEMQAVYDRITHTSTQERQLLTSPVYVSIAGGHKDATIHSSLAVTDRIVDSSRGFAVLTTAMPEVKLTMDHLCLLWCHQLLKVVAKSIDAIVHKDARDIVKNALTRVEIVQRHLLGEGGDASSVLFQHQQSVLDGYALAQETYEQYGLLTPKWLFHLLRTRITSVYMIILALAVYLFGLQVAHWQSRFDLQTTSDDVAFPSFTSLLHPLAHVPAPIKTPCSWLWQKLTDPQTKKALVAVAGACVVGASALAFEFARRSSVAVSQGFVAMEFIVLYTYALGLMYGGAVVLSALSDFVLSPVMDVIVGAASRWKIKWWQLGIVIYALVFLAGHVKSLLSFQLASVDSTRSLALVVLGSMIVYLVSLVLLGTVGGLDRSADQKRMRGSLFGIFLLSVLPWLGKLVYYAALVSMPPSSLTNEVLAEGCSYTAVLLLAAYAMLIAQERMIPLPPPAFFGASTGEDSASMYGSSGSSNASGKNAPKITAENCPKCIFEDGGAGAVFVEYMNRSTQRIKSKSEVVFVGPTFRVVSCDCVYRHEKSRDFCGFCVRSCRFCGGGDGNFQQAQKFKEYLDDSKMELASHALVPFTLQVLAGVLVFYGLNREHIAFYVGPICSVLLLCYNRFLRNAIEEKKHRNKLKNKTKKKKSKSAKSSSSAYEEAGPDTKTKTVKAKASSQTTTTTKTVTATVTNEAKSTATKKKKKSKRGSSSTSIFEE